MDTFVGITLEQLGHVTPALVLGVTCFSFVVRVLICSLYDSSLWLA